MQLIAYTAVSPDKKHYTTITMQYLGSVNIYMRTTYVAINQNMYVCFGMYACLWECMLVKYDGHTYCILQVTC